MSVTDLRFAVPAPRKSLWLGLAAVTLVGCSEGPGSGVSQALLDEAARAIAREAVQMTPEQLSDAIISGNRPVGVIDLRSLQMFEQGHIKGARNIALPSLLSDDGRSAIGADGVPVLVSEDGVLAAQASALLRVAGVDARVLAGGYGAWRRYLSPGSDDAATGRDAALSHAKRQAAACWFEGDYVATAGLVPRMTSTPASDSAGYVPPLKPVTEAKADPLGLGLGLGLGPPPEKKPPPKKKRKLKVREGC